MANWIDNFNKVNKYTNEKEVLIKAISSYILKNKYKSYLDIGCGDGKITCELSKFFEVTSVLDKKRSVQKYLLKNIKYYKNAYELNNTKFDFILLSYVLGINYKSNIKLMTVASKLLTENGTICIINLSERNKFKYNYKEYTSALNEFNKVFWKVEGFYLDSKLVSSNYNLPRSEISLFKKTYGVGIKNLVENIYISKTGITFNLYHNILFAKKNTNKRLYLFSGNVCSGKTTSAIKFSNLCGGHYFNIDNYLRKLANLEKEDFNVFLNNLIKKDKLFIAKLILNKINIEFLKHKTIVMDGIFSLDELDYLNMALSAKIYSIYVLCDKKERIERAKKRFTQKNKAKPYIDYVDNMCKNYGGGAEDYYSFDYVINNNGTKKELYKKLKEINYEIRRLFTSGKN